MVRIKDRNRVRAVFRVRVGMRFSIYNNMVKGDRWIYFPFNFAPTFVFSTTLFIKLLLDIQPKRPALACGDVGGGVICSGVIGMDALASYGVSIGPETQSSHS